MSSPMMKIMLGLFSAADVMVAPNASEATSMMLVEMSAGNRFMTYYLFASTDCDFGRVRSEPSTFSLVKIKSDLVYSRRFLIFRQLEEIALWVPWATTRALHIGGTVGPLRIR